jgi:PAS domain S-box-containing protein
MKLINDFSEKLTVLIIEDNLGDFVLIEEYLHEKFNLIEIIHVATFANAIECLQNGKVEVSLILLDLHLPDINGLDLINKLLSYNFHVPIIVLTGYSDLGLVNKSLQLGVYDYLVKDEINPVILHKTIVFALNRSDFVHQLEEEKKNYENIFNFNPQPTWLLDSNSLQILHANIAAQKKYGFLLDDFLKMTFDQLHPEEEEALIAKKFTSKEEALNSKYFTHFLSNGNEIHVDIYFRKINNGAKNKLIVQSNDISETVRQLKTIETQNATLSKIAWTQSNVLNAPVTRILEIVNLMEEQPDNLDKISFWLAQLKISSMEVENILKKIIDQTSRTS